MLLSVAVAMASAQQAGDLPHKRVGGSLRAGCGAAAGGGGRQRIRQLDVICNAASRSQAERAAGDAFPRKSSVLHYSAHILPAG